MADVVTADHPARPVLDLTAPERATAWPAVDVVVLTWRAGVKAVQALDALRRCGYPDLRVIVVDNGSDDGADRLVWARFEQLHPTAVRVEAGVGPLPAALPDENGPVYIRSSVNRGFAGGMNLGLELVRRSGRAAYFWTLNNDTMPQPGAAHALVGRCEEDPGIGLCGCTQEVLSPDGTRQLQLPGGFAYRRLSGSKEHIELPVAGLAGRMDVEQRMTAVVGSSFFGPRRFLDEVGLFGTDRFIYGEEIEWAARARSGGFRLAWAPEAVIRTVHRGTLEEVDDEARTILTRYLGARARFRYAAKHDRWCVPTVVAAQLWQAGQDLRAGSRRVAWAGLSGLFDGAIGRHRLFPQLGAALYPGTVRA